MDKRIVLTVAPARKLALAEQLMLSAQEHLPGWERRVVVLDPPEASAEAVYSFTPVLAESIWGEGFLEAAFFYTEDEFCTVLAARAARAFLAEAEACLVLKADCVLQAGLPQLDGALGESRTVLFAAPPAYKDVLPAPDAGAALAAATVETARVFCRGAAMDRFLGWVENEFDSLRRLAVTANDWTVCGPQCAFYRNWPDAAPLFGCARQVLDASAAVWPFTQDAAQAALVDFSRAPSEERLEEDAPLAALYARHKKAAPPKTARYRYDYFEDGTPLLPTLRRYYAVNFRLWGPSAGNPFAHRALFTDENMALGKEGGVPYTASFASVIASRPDVQACFSAPSGAGFDAYMDWMLRYGVAEYELPDVYYKDIARQYDAEQARRRAEDAKNRKLSTRLLRRAGLLRPAPPPARPHGVNLTGYIRGDFGLGEACRILAETLDGQGIPLAVTEIANPTIHTYTNDTWAGRITNTFPYNVNLLYTNADGLDHFLAETSPQAFAGRYNIAYWAWELPTFPERWCHLFGAVDEVWTLSGFAAEAIRAKTEKPVFVLPPAVRVGEADETLTRADFGLPPDDFVFLMMYDVNSIIQRKNPQGALEAFRQAFGGKPGATLVIKANARPGAGTAKDFEFLEMAARQPNVRVLTQHFSRAGVNALIGLCDAFVSLHRSEGFGLGPAEAMYLGKPSVLTGWSGNMEYTAPAVCHVVKYKLVEIDKDYGPYKKGMTWAEPDIADAAAGMKKLAEDKAYYQSLSEAGKRKMREEFSVAALGQKARGRLAELGLI